MTQWDGTYRPRRHGKNTERIEYLHTRLQRAEELLAEAKGWCPQESYSTGGTDGPWFPAGTGIRARIDAFLGGSHD